MHVQIPPPQLLEPRRHGVERFAHRAVVRQAQRAVRRPRGRAVAQAHLEPVRDPVRHAQPLAQPVHVPARVRDGHRAAHHQRARQVGGPARVHGGELPVAPEHLGEDLVHRPRRGR